MLWRFGFHNVSKVELLLDKGQVSLSELLNEDDLLNEMLEFIMSQENVIDRLLDHLDISSMSEIILKLANIDEVSSDLGVQSWLYEQRLIPKLLSLLNPSLDEDLHSLGTQVILDLIMISSPDRDIHGTLFENPLMEQLKSPESIAYLLDFMLNSPEKNSSSSLINGVYIFIELIRRSTSEQEQEGDYFPTIVGEDLFDPLIAICPRISRLIYLLDNPRSSQTTLRNTTGSFIPLGFERLRICEFLAEILNCSKMLIFNLTASEIENELKSNLSEQDLAKFQLPSALKSYDQPIGISIKHEFINCSVLKTVLNLFFAYPWNNFLHSVVYDLAHQVLSLPFGDDIENINAKLVISLFEDSQITSLIMENYYSHATDSLRIGYMGHLLGIAEEISRLLDSLSPNMKQAIEPFIDLERWEIFIKDAFSDPREIEPETQSIDLSRDGSDPTDSINSNPLDDDFDALNHSSTMDSEFPPFPRPLENSPDIVLYSSGTNIESNPFRSENKSPVSISSNSTPDSFKNIDISPLPREVVTISQDLPLVDASNLGDYVSSKERSKSLNTLDLEKSNNSCSFSNDENEKVKELIDKTLDLSLSKVLHSPDPLGIFFPNENSEFNKFPNTEDDEPMQSGDFSLEKIPFRPNLRKSASARSSKVTMLKLPLNDYIEKEPENLRSEPVTSLTNKTFNPKLSLLINNTEGYSDYNKTGDFLSSAENKSSSNSPDDYSLEMQFSKAFSNLPARLKEAREIVKKERSFDERFKTFGSNICSFPKGMDTFPTKDLSSSLPEENSDMFSAHSYPNNDLLDSKLEYPSNESSEYFSLNKNINVNESLDDMFKYETSDKSATEDTWDGDITPFPGTRRRSRSHSAGVGVSRNMALAKIKANFPFNLDTSTTEFLGQLETDQSTNIIPSSKVSFFKVSPANQNILSPSMRLSPTVHSSLAFSPSIAVSESPVIGTYHQSFSGISSGISKTKAQQKTPFKQL
ncbi:hypothetical protein BB560_004018 [Smittium megazygosporum]|uniref:Uncharacterized protein n=1 Tax=Smittium megazygosporum TaxID=133381 RepID=A0A2T9ZAH3_9FUNG|nr:hypothetical protein BB560_004018 [Smittium megazygosporum]